MRKKMPNRFSIFLSDETLKKLDDFCKKFATGTEEGNRSKVISNLINRYIPNTSSLSD